MSEMGSSPSGDGSLYLRKWNVNVSNASEALDLSELHIVFSTTQSDLETPNSCLVRIYNLSDTTSSRLLSKEYTGVTISAGYENGPYGVIFDGQIKQTRRGKENQTDKYLDILGADGDEAYNFSVINNTLAAGSSLKQRIDSIAQAMGLQVGYLSSGLEVGNPQLSIRGKAQYGIAKDYMRQIAISNNARWSIQGGRLVIIANSDMIQASPIVLSPATGLIGIPEQTFSGISAKCLLNPKIVIGQPIQIDSTSINTVLFNLGPPNEDQDIGILPQNLAPPLATAGIYRVVVCEYNGDTRGNDWYTRLTCFAASPDAAAGNAVNPWP